MTEEKQKSKPGNGLDTDHQLPVDRGWAWVILTVFFSASTLITFLYAGTFKSFGIFYVEILAVFGGNVATTTLISSLQLVVYCLSSVPILTVLLRHCSIRSCQVVGICLTALGFGLSSLATSLVGLIITQSINGLGMALVYPTSFILIGKYFKLRIGLANGIMMSGFALGGVALPPVFRLLFEEFGLRGGLLLTAGVILNTLPPALLLRPMEFYTQRHQRADTTSIDKRSDVTDEKENLFTPEQRSTSLIKDLQKLKHVYIDQNNLSASEPNVSSSGRLSPLICKRNRASFENRSRNLNYLSESKLLRYVSNNELASLSQLDTKWQQLGDKVSQDSSDSTKYKRFSCQMCSCKLWSNRLYLLLIPIYCFGTVGPETAHLYTPSFAKDLGIEHSRIATVVSVQSLCDFIGRILFGFLADLPFLKEHRILLCTQVISGLLLQMTPLIQGYWALVLLCAVYGLLAGIVFSMIMPLILSVVGQDMYPSAMAAAIVIRGSFVAGMVPILGFLRDSTVNYYATFHFMGATSLICAFFLFLFEIMSSKMRKWNTAESIVFEH